MSKEIVIGGTPYLAEIKDTIFSGNDVSKEARLSKPIYIYKDTPDGIKKIRITIECDTDGFFSKDELKIILDSFFIWSPELK